VHCISEHAAAHFTANALLALGGSSAVVEDMSEVPQFVKLADSLLVNTGTVTKAQTEAMRAAVSHANMNGKPWVLDPVAVGVLPLRTFIAKELLRRFPAMIRGNASEILFLAGNEAAVEAVPPACKRLFKCVTVFVES
jgi:hydroxyethylthiazole kinase